MILSLSLWFAVILGSGGMGLAGHSLWLIGRKGPVDDAGMRGPFRGIPWTGSKTVAGPRWVLVIGMMIGPVIMRLFGTGPGLLFLLAWSSGWWVSRRGAGIKARFSERKRLEKAEILFPQALGMAIQGLKVGQTVPQAILYLSQECPSPLREEFAMVCSEMDLGSSTEEALSRLADRVPSHDGFRQLLECYKVSRRSGANLTRLLEVLVEGIEEKCRLERRMKAMTAQARLSGSLMGVLPIILGLVFYVMDPELMEPLFNRKEGWAILGLAFFLETFGFLWIRGLLREEH